MDVQFRGSPDINVEVHKKVPDASRTGDFKILQYYQGSICHLLLWHIDPCRFPLDVGEYIMFIAALILYFVLSIGVKRSVGKMKGESGKSIKYYNCKS